MYVDRLTPVRIGIPPEKLERGVTKETLLSDVGLTSGDLLTVVTTGEPKGDTERTDAVEKNQDGKDGNPTEDSRAKKTRYVKEGPGYVVLRNVPDDNSCLFTSLALLLLDEPHMDGTGRMKDVVVDEIRRNASWNEAMLDMPRNEYMRKIKMASFWGGGIELAIIAERFRVEIWSWDCESGIVYKFGDDAGYHKRVFLVYSGIHYDALSFSFSQPRDPTEEEVSVVGNGGNIEFLYLVTRQDILQFPKDSTFMQSMVAGSEKLVGELRASKYYTNPSRMRIRCESCDVIVEGQEEAQRHANATGHADYSGA